MTNWSYFQFPQSERVNCNPRTGRTRTRCARLSVSTIGTSELQPHVVRDCRRRDVLSVSTIGTSELQQNENKSINNFVASFQFPQSERVNCNQQQTAGHLIKTFSFQFPQSERVNCNNWTTPGRHKTIRLSVSTIGTSELQPCSNGKKNPP